MRTVSVLLWFCNTSSDPVWKVVVVNVSGGGGGGGGGGEEGLPPPQPVQREAARHQVDNIRRQLVEVIPTSGRRVAQPGWKYLGVADSSQENLVDKDGSPPSAPASLFLHRREIP